MSELTGEMTKRPVCGAENKIVNQCKCDPNNLPTPVQNGDIIEELAYKARVLIREHSYDDLIQIAISNGIDFKGIDYFSERRPSSLAWLIVTHQSA